jgi:hypothetical protein
LGFFGGLAGVFCGVRAGRSPRDGVSAKETDFLFGVAFESPKRGSLRGFLADEGESAGPLNFLLPCMAWALFGCPTAGAPFAASDAFEFLSLRPNFFHAGVCGAAQSPEPLIVFCCVI